MIAFDGVVVDLGGDDATMGGEVSQLGGNAEGTQKKIDDEKANVEPVDEVPMGTEEHSLVKQPMLQNEVDDKAFFTGVEGRFVRNMMHNYNLIERRLTNIEQKMNDHMRELHEEVAQMRLQLKEILEVEKRAWEVQKF
ncbi:hypothetical protein Scep_026409 [Stephania cephalantha]|uniref:Uncharacterized protein n=1 Tax=Stephania cephalantha TaxID=152367 RepID=A0AAP0EMN1_9MAGN